MMYETEEQQVEALKKWWKENGKSIIAGVALGLAGVLGWRYWGEYRDTVAGKASNRFDQLVMAVRSGELDQVTAQAELIRKDFGSTPYADFSYLIQAKALLDKGDMAGATVALQQAVDQAPDPAIQAIAVLRLARLQLAEDQLDAAEALLEQHPATPAFAGEYAVVRGDLARARGDVEAARQAYLDAIAANAGNADLMQLKLENLPPVPAS
jgi:predicted negative regulator of RcsB-dependent stress response